MYHNCIISVPQLYHDCSESQRIRDTLCLADSGCMAEPFHRLKVCRSVHSSKSNSKLVDAVTVVTRRVHEGHGVVLRWCHGCGACQEDMPCRSGAPKDCLWLRLPSALSFLAQVGRVGPSPWGFLGFLMDCDGCRCWFAPFRLGGRHTCKCG